MPLCHKASLIGVVRYHGEALKREQIGACDLCGPFVMQEGMTRARVMSIAIASNSFRPSALGRAIAISFSPSAMRSVDIAFWTVAICWLGSSLVFRMGW